MAEFSKTFVTVPNVMRSTTYLKRHLNHILDVIEEYPDGADPGIMTEDDLVDLLAELEKCDEAIRASAEDYLFVQNENEENADLPAYKNLPVEVTFEDNILRIQCPIMVNRNYKEAHHLGNCVDVGLKILEEEQGVDLFQKIRAPWFTLIVRHFTRETHSSYYRDNDHMEEANVINKIARQFFTADDKFSMGFTSIAVLTREKKSYTDIFAYDLRSYDRMTGYIKDLISERNPCVIRSRALQDLRNKRDAESKKNVNIKH